MDIAANTHNTNWSIGVTNPTTYDLNGNPAEHRGISQTTLNLTQLQRASMGSKPYAYKSGTNTPQTIGGWNYGADATGNPAEHRGISQTTLNITFATSSGITMTYDPFTELTMREVKGGERQNYQYDGKKERVLKIDSVTSGGNTIVTKTLYIQGLNDYPLMVLNGSTEYVYVYGIGGIAAMRVQGWWYYVMRDHLGSTKLIISNTSFVAARYEYDPYGKILDTSSITTGSNYQFTGQELDETGLYNFRARMYDTSAAIFYAADQANQGYSRYGYCLGNPVSLVDPTGRYGEPKVTINGMDWGPIGLEWYNRIMGAAVNVAFNLTLNRADDVREGKINGFFTENTLIYVSTENQGGNNANPFSKAFVEGNLVVTGIHKWTWTEWSMATLTALYIDLASNYILDRMQNMPGYGNGPFTKTGKGGYGQGKDGKPKWKSEYRNDCTSRVSFATLEGPGLNSRNASDYFGESVDYNPSHLQVVVWPGEHAGLTKDGKVYDMTPEGYNKGTHTIEWTSRFTHGVEPVYYEIK